MMNTEPWHIRRKIELEAAAPMKRKKVEAFVKVLIELLRLQWKTRRMSFPVPNARLKNLGVSREVKRRVLRDLQRAGLITVDRRTRKSPIVTLVSL